MTVSNSMQHAFIVTKIEAYLTEQAGEVFKLHVTDYRKRAVWLLGRLDQQVNIQTLKNQQLPVVLISDQLESGSEGQFLIPASSLVSIVPLPAASLQQVLELGRADEILQSLSLKSC